MHAPMTIEQHQAYDFMVRAGLGTRTAYAIIREGFLSTPAFCAARSARDMLRIPNFGKASLRDIMNYAAKHKIPFNDDRLKPTVRPITEPKRISTLPEPEPVWAGPKWEYLVVDRPFANNRETTEKRLNEYGQLGWDIARASRHAIIFKRPAQ